VLGRLLGLRDLAIRVGGGPTGLALGLVQRLRDAAAGVGLGLLDLPAGLGLGFGDGLLCLLVGQVGPAMGLDPTATEPMALSNTGHPANSRVLLANAAHSNVNVFGLSWNDSAGRHNGQYAPFTWASA